MFAQIKDECKRPIGLRHPCMDPTNLLQVELLARWRERGREDEDLFRALLSIINDIAHGLQQSGWSIPADPGGESSSRRHCECSDAIQSNRKPLRFSADVRCGLPRRLRFLAVTALGNSGSRIVTPAPKDILIKGHPGLDQRRVTKMRFSQPSIFNGLAPLKMPAHPCAAGRSD